MNYFKILTQTLNLFLQDNNMYEINLGSWHVLQSNMLNHFKVGLSND